MDLRCLGKLWDELDELELKIEKRRFRYLNIWIFKIVCSLNSIIFISNCYDSSFLG